MILEGIIGVVTGLIGTVTTTVFNLKAQKLKNEHELKMIHAQTSAMIAEAEANIKITEAQVAGEVEKKELDAFIKSQEYGNATALDNKTLEKLYESKWTLGFGVLLTILLGFVDFLKNLMRPGLTAYLVFLTSYLTYEAVKIIQLKQELLTVTMAVDMFDTVTNIVIYLTVSVVTWWFGDRRVAKFLYRLNDGNLRDN